MSTNKNETESTGAKRRSHQPKHEEQCDLDLTYITPNIIAMSFPASGLKAIYGNSIDDVVDFFSKKHANHYMVYNLCHKKTYDHEKFDNFVIRYPIDNNSVPLFDDIEPFNDALHEWLTDNNENIAAIHNTNGKGSVGMIIAVYLLYNNRYKSASDAIRYFNTTRCNNPMKGLTVPSQIRYVKYYEKLMLLQRYEKLMPTLYITRKKYKIDKIFLSNSAPKFSTVVIKCKSVVRNIDDNTVVKKHDGGCIIS
eukprot:555515_1